MMAAVGREGRGRSAVQGLRAGLSQRIQELQDVAALREQGQKILTHLCEQKLAETRQRLPPLRETVQEYIYTLDTVRVAPRSKVTFPEACRAERPMGVLTARKAVELALEKVQAEIYGRTNTYNALQYEVRRRRQVLGKLQRRLQQLESAAAAGDRQHQEQMRVIHQLENSIEKMLVKVRAAQKVTTQYLAVRDVLRKELVHLPQHLDLLSGMAESFQRELEDMEPTASHALRAAEVAKTHMEEMRSWFLAESELRHRSLAAQKVPRDRHWLQEASTKHPKAVSWGTGCGTGCGQTAGIGAEPPWEVGGRGAAGSSGADDDHPCCRPGTSSAWASCPSTRRTRWWTPRRRPPRPSWSARPG
ncbi:coiled-coil domain-containing protein 183-like isoform 1-T1 [Porphyrio hochstetteri]